MLRTPERTRAQLRRVTERVRHTQPGEAGSISRHCTHRGRRSSIRAYSSIVANTTGNDPERRPAPAKHCAQVSNEDLRPLVRGEVPAARVFLLKNDVAHRARPPVRVLISTPHSPTTNREDRRRVDTHILGGRMSSLGKSDTPPGAAHHGTAWFGFSPCLASSKYIRADAAGPALENQ